MIHRCAITGGYPGTSLIACPCVACEAARTRHTPASTKRKPPAVLGRPVDDQRGLVNLRDDDADPGEGLRTRTAIADPDLTARTMDGSGTVKRRGAGESPAVCTYGREITIDDVLTYSEPFDF